MPSLSQYLNFEIVADFSLSTPKLKVVDTSSYPGGVAAGITGIISATQPDLITVTGNFGSPDIIYSGGALTVGQKELRLGNNGSPQSGGYSVTYTVRHGSYTDTSLTKTFVLDYTRPKLIITASMDVFTPLLKVIDSSDYTIDDLTLVSVTRAWSVDIGSLTTKTGTGAEMNLSYLGNYYDSTYVIRLTSTVEWDLVLYPFVSMFDKLAAEKTTSAFIPPTLAELLTMLSDYKNEVDVSGCSTHDSRNINYLSASALYNQLIERGRLNDIAGLDQYVYDIQRFLNNNMGVPYTNTNTIIPNYEWGVAATPGGGGGGNANIFGGNL